MTIVALATAGALITAEATITEVIIKMIFRMDDDSGPGDDGDGGMSDAGPGDDSDGWDGPSSDSDNSGGWANH